MALWPLAGLILNWSTYRLPGLAAVVYVAAVALPMFLWWLGPRGIGPVVSLLTSSAAVGLTLLLGLDLGGPHPVAGYFMNSWGVATAFVLAFARPIEEPLASMVAVTIVNATVTPNPLHDPQALHEAPMEIGPAIPMAIFAVALVAALRTGARGVRRTRELAAAMEERRAVADAVHHERLA